MNKLIFLFFLVFLNGQLFGQIISFEEKIDSIPTMEQDRKFIAFVKRDYVNLIKEKVDTVLLFYEIIPSNNYAVLFWKKKNGLTKCEAYYEYLPNISELGKEVLENKTLKKIDFCNIYSILKDNDVRTEDTTIMISHNYPLYCQFYFGGKTECYAGFQGIVRGRVNLDFLNAYTEEQNRIVRREMKKYNAGD